ncbi:hypothetical protein A6V39_00720 [Candidatus Mycoplasma haematobovis]|uniref:Uncharacterized protein n=1 Tax=Candidatus Mycoplasma haematobovis TaxID=432608 RepID=A0A1A9QEL3_9MOLU|nr:hypothetical protein [Candidatus Mycoplasma haematobovis]OAL10574.1 hypothetical protein A6V39_00720 [Candidatus Mycoplasma haematobovis]
MQLRFTPPLVTTVATSGFRQGISSILSGLTVAGAFSTVIFSSNLASEKVSEPLDKFVKVLKASPLYDGIAQVATTLKDWGSAVVGAKDDLKSWIERYLGADGLKSGVAQLAEKLQAWGLIVYNWFATKFIEFVKNIPKMVQEWDKLRLSLFKWGTFLGGGGSSALWAVFSSGENFDKFSKLMERDDFGEIMSSLTKLVEENNEAFNNMESEELQEIIEKFLDEPDEAKKTTEELLKKQEEKKEEAKKDPTQEDKEPQLEEQEIKDAFSPRKGGNPQTTAEVLGSMAERGLGSLLDLPYSSFGGFSLDLARNKAKAAMNQYIQDIRSDVEKETKRKNAKPSAKKQFLDIIQASETQFVDALAKNAMIAASNITKKPKLEDLAKEFAKALEGAFTTVCQDNEDCAEVDIAGLLNKKG